MVDVQNARSGGWRSRCMQCGTPVLAPSTPCAATASALIEARAATQRFAPGALAACMAGRASCFRALAHRYVEAKSLELVRAGLTPHQTRLAYVCGLPLGCSREDSGRARSRPHVSLPCIACAGILSIEKQRKRAHCPPALPDCRIRHRTLRLAPLHCTRGSSVPSFPSKHTDVSAAIVGSAPAQTLCHMRIWSTPCITLTRPGRCCACYSLSRATTA